MKSKYVNVALNIPLNSLFTYKVPDYFNDEADTGKRVLVTFGRKTLTGVILEVTDSTILKNVKDIKAVIDSQRIISDELIRFSYWLSEYYLAPIGEVIFSSIPRNINIKSEMYYFLESDYKFKLDISKLKDEINIEIIRILEKAENSGLTKKQIERKLSLNDAANYINRLKEEGIIRGECYFSKPTKEKNIKIISKNFNTDELTSLIKEFNLKSRKQIQLLKYIAADKKFELSELQKEIGISAGSINSLLKKEIIKIEEIRKHRDSIQIFKEDSKEIILNEMQDMVLEKINEAVDSALFKTFLLHGITGSGKTEVYINAIKNVISKEKTAVVLVPEISLTPQLIYRFKKIFNDIVGIIHSKLSDGEKLDTYDRIHNGKFRIIIGARSAIFAPLKNIGIIIVDEEHDSSYKQENLPKYHGRDAAIYRAKLNNAVVLLGSATPSIESYYNAQNGKYTLLNLPERAGKIKLPEIKILDLLKSQKEEFDDVKKDFFDKIDKVRVKFLSKELIFEIGERLDRKESIIILQNRRGYHSYIECLNCGNVEMCVRCNISLTYHKAFDILKCHYCGFVRRFAKVCSVCNSSMIIPKGAGTERVEEELIKIFPSAVIKRMDSDTLTSRKLYQQILKDFYDKKIDILAGTQIISKGLDFPNVTLVGVINADIGLLNPDFRATEKTFQILTQVAGRSGRSDKKGEVLIQTNHSDFYVFADVKNHDYNNFYENEIRSRKLLNYPPFSRLTIIETKSEDRLMAESKVKELFNLAIQSDESKILNILPPVAPLFSKLKDKYRYHLIIKSSKQKDPTGKILHNILNKMNDYISKNIPKKVYVSIDIDAVNLL